MTDCLYCGEKTKRKKLYNGKAYHRRCERLDRFLARELKDSRWHYSPLIDRMVFQPWRKK